MKTTIKAYAKINLGLNVYQLKPWQKKHKIKSIFVRHTGFADDIEITPHQNLVIQHFTNGQPTIYERDVIKKALLFLHDEFQIELNFKIIIHKHIPDQAGLGGSSASVGAILRFLVELHQLKISKSLYKKIALQIGSDVPFFMHDYKCCLVSGYGHLLKPLDVPMFKYELVPNDLQCNSAAIFKTFDELHQHLPKNDFKQLTNVWPNFKACIIINNLEPAAFSLCPQLQAYKTESTFMTGSGSYFVKIKE